MNKLEIPKIEPAFKIVEKIKSGELKAYDLVKEHLERAVEINKHTNSFISILDTSKILQKASEIDKKIASGENVGKLAGIPFTAKDLYLVEDERTTFGSKIMEDYIAPYTATTIKRLEQEGAILIAKANCDPWGNGGSGENSGYGPTKHPLDLERTPGGSSSGSGASLLAGVGFFSLGTDTGGSVRNPASFCGLYGLKPTYGRNSRYGIGAMASSFDTPGFLARYIEDLSLVEEIIAGKDTYDFTTVNKPVEDYYNSTVNTDISYLKGKKVGIIKEYGTGDALQLEVKKSYDSFIEKLKNNGVEVIEVSIPTINYGISAYYVLVPSEISSNRARYDGVRYGKYESDMYEENMIITRSKYLEDEVKRRIMIGTYALSAGYADQFYKKATLVREKIKNEFEKAFNTVDVILSPVVPTTAFKIGEKSTDPLQMYLMDIYTVTANLVGIPAIAFPTGKDNNGLPIGLQFMGKMFSEEELFKLVKAVN